MDVVKCSLLCIVMYVSWTCMGLYRCIVNSLMIMITIATSTPLHIHNVYLSITFFLDQSISFFSFLCSDLSQTQYF